jgi:hypothetical protein
LDAEPTSAVVEDSRRKFPEEEEEEEELDSESELGLELVVLLSAVGRVGV